MALQVRPDTRITTSKVLAWMKESYRWDWISVAVGPFMIANSLRKNWMAYAQPHPRLSGVSTTERLSPTTSSTRFSVPQPPFAKYSANRPNIYDRNLNKTRNAEVSGAAFAFLFSEIVQYTQKRVSGINDLERQWLVSCLSPILYLISGKVKYCRLSCWNPGTRTYYMARRRLLESTQARNQAFTRSDDGAHTSLESSLRQSGRCTRKKRRKLRWMYVSPYMTS